MSSPLFLELFLCLLFLKMSQPKIIFMPKRHILGWYILLPFICICREKHHEKWYLNGWNWVLGTLTYRRVQTVGMSYIPVTGWSTQAFQTHLMRLSTMWLIRRLGFLGACMLLYGWSAFCSPFPRVKGAAQAYQPSLHLTYPGKLPQSHQAELTPLFVPYNFLIHTLFKHVIIWHYLCIWLYN